MNTVVSLCDHTKAFDAKAVALKAQLGPEATWPRPTGYRIMVAQYVRPTKTKGGIILTDSTRKEDVYQGNVGLVLSLGDDAYIDAARYPNGAWCKPGDWVLWSSYATQGRRIEIGTGSEKVSIAFLNEDEVLGTVTDPDQAL